MSIEQKLDRLTLPQTRRLILTLLTEHPDWIEEYDRQISQITPTPSIPPAPKQTTVITVDPASFRRQVRQIFHNAINAWESGDDDDTIADDLLELIQEADKFTHSGNGENAISVLTGITQGCIESWDEVDNYGADSDDFVAALNEAWSEAILTVELTVEAQEKLRSDLESWEDLSMALDALQQGWHYPPLLKVLSGEITEAGAWAGEIPSFADRLAIVRLNILERQERYQEYLYLAEAEGQSEQYLTMLARTGQVEAAMAEAPAQMTTLDEAFALAKMLRQQGAIVPALEIAQQGLKLPCRNLYDSPYEFAIWSSDLAESQGNVKIALANRIMAFKERPSFLDYQKIEALAANDWATIRKKLLQTLDTDNRWGNKEASVDIFLHEGLIDRAISTVKNLSYYCAPLVHRVMDIAITTHPDWVIENAQTRAEEIMNRGKSAAYYHAAEWLRKMKAAYLQSDQPSEWSTYHQQLMLTHSRKSSLMSFLKHL